tara:strand:+ start:1267 stop:1740 length:474 start_codon:yes stop_codon:yes gene_type:complete
MKDYSKKIIFIFCINFIELSIAPIISKVYIIFPLTFLSYSFYAYRSNKDIGPIEAFLIGLLIDLISGTYFGLNATLFCIVTYLINIYSNAFKIFSYLQVCIFFGLSATAYIGFNQLASSLYNFSYLTLLLSSIFNILFCIFLARLSLYFPKTINTKI